MTVEDSGPGVAAEHRDRLFDRFHRSTEQGGSAGLGLAIADSIVRTTDAQWRLGESELGGALFEVSWRRVSSRQASTVLQPVSVPSPVRDQLADDGPVGPPEDEAVVAGDPGEPAAADGASAAGGSSQVAAI